MKRGGKLKEEVELRLQGPEGAWKPRRTRANVWKHCLQTFGSSVAVDSQWHRIQERKKAEKRLIRLIGLRHVVRAVLSVRPKCSHRCVSLKEFPLVLARILKQATRISTEQTSMRTRWFKHIAM